MSKFIGKGTFLPGSTTECSLNFSDSVNTGLYESKTGTLNLVASGTSILQVDTEVKAQAVLNMQSNKITNVATPTSGTDGVNKTYVDGQITASAGSAGNGLQLSSNTYSVVGSTTIYADSKGVYVNSSSTANQVLLSNGTTGTEAKFGALPLGNSNSVTGTLPVANGGSGVTSLTANAVLIGNGTSGIQTSSTSLNSAGSMVMAGGLSVTTRSVSSASSTITVAATDYLVIVQNTASIAINLPASSGNTGRKLMIVKTGSSSSNTLTVTPNGSETINGTLSSVVLRNIYDRVSLVCDGVSSWYVE